jgi:ribosomal protein S18 acetylase RimI-like enzyme
MGHESLIADQWLSAVLKRDTYRLAMEGDAGTDMCDRAGTGYRALQDLKRGPLFLYSRVSPTRMDRIAFLEEEGFHLVDTTLTMEKPMTVAEPREVGADVRFAAAGDADETAALAGRAFAFSRFHLDPAFSRETADRIKAEWARSFFSGRRGNAMVLAEVDHRVAGFLQLLYTRGTLVIDLIAVDERHRRKGIANAMISYAESQCGDFETIRVGTQVANTPSLRFYGKAGFLVSASNYVFHYHHPSPEENGER